MRKIMLLLFFIPPALFAQSGAKVLIETPIGKSEKETYLFLKGLLDGQNPVMQYDGNFRSYDFNTEVYHVEYKVIKDTCVIAGIRFKKNDGAYEQTTKQILSETRLVDGLRIRKEYTDNGVIYDLDDKNKVITLLTMSYAITSSKNQ